jgi:hypothetical protein
MPLCRKCVIGSFWPVKPVLGGRSGHSGGLPAPGARSRPIGWRPAWNPAVFPCFWLESGYIARHLTRKHGSKGRPVAAGP